MPVSKAQKLAQKKYNEQNIDMITFKVKKGRKAEYKQAAEERGIGFMELIRLAIEEYIENHPVKESPTRQAEVV